MISILLACIFLVYGRAAGQTLHWTEISPIGQKPPPQTPDSVLYGDKMVIPLSYIPPYISSTNLADVWTLDLSTNAWAQWNTTGTKPSSAASSFLHKDQIVALECGADYSNDFKVMNLSSREWTLLNTTGTKPAVRFCTSILYKDQLVLFGGHIFGTQPTLDENHTIVNPSYLSNDVWILNLATLAWTKINTTGTKPTGRGTASATVYNDKMVIFGGNIYTLNKNGFTSTTIKINDGWVLNLTTYEWNKLNTTGAKPNTYGSPVLLFNDQILLFGGNDPDACSYTCYSNNIWSLDLRTRAWTKLNTSGTKPLGRSAHTTVVYNNKFVLFGGYNVDGPSGKYQNDVWTLTLPASAATTTLPPDTSTTTLVSTTTEGSSSESDISPGGFTFCHSAPIIISIVLSLMHQ
jgi:N-acetylneuraminic acid mutarotase